MYGYEIFKKLMEERNLTSYKVAQETGISQATLSDWKNGKCKPKADKMKMLSMYFGVDLDYLMGESPIRKKLPMLNGMESVPEDGTQAALNKIAAALNFNPLDSLPDREKRLLQSFSLLTDDMQQSFLDLIESVAKSSQQ